MYKMSALPFCFVLLSIAYGNEVTPRGTDMATFEYVAMRARETMQGLQSSSSNSCEYLHDKLQTALKDEQRRPEPNQQQLDQLMEALTAARGCMFSSPEKPHSGVLQMDLDKLASDLETDFDGLNLEVDSAFAQAVKSRGKDNTVIVMASNDGYATLTSNTVASLHKLGFHNYVIVGLDDKACALISADPGSCVAVEGDHVSASAQPYRSQEYKKIVQQKPIWVKKAVDMGYNVLFTDTDIVWLKDPLPYLKKFTTDDVVFQNDVEKLDLHNPEPQRIVDPCSGFYYVKSTTGGKAFMEHWLTDIRANPALGRGDQFFAGRAMAAAYKQPFKYHLLNQLDFPNGFVFWQKGMKKGASNSGTPFIVHNNFIVGVQPKINRFKASGFWYIN